MPINATDNMTLADEFKAWEKISGEDLSVFYHWLDSGTACPGVRNQQCPVGCACSFAPSSMEKAEEL